MLQANIGGETSKKCVQVIYRSKSALIILQGVPRKERVRILCAEVRAGSQERYIRLDYRPTAAKNHTEYYYATALSNE